MARIAPLAFSVILFTSLELTTYVESRRYARLTSRPDSDSEIFRLESPDMAGCVHICAGRVDCLALLYTDTGSQCVGYLALDGGGEPLAGAVAMAVRLYPNPAEISIPRSTIGCDAGSVHHLAMYSCDKSLDDNLQSYWSTPRLNSPLIAQWITYHLDEATFVTSLDYTMHRYGSHLCALLELTLDTYTEQIVMGCDINLVPNPAIVHITFRKPTFLTNAVKLECVTMCPAMEFFAVRHMEINELNLEEIK